MCLWYNIIHKPKFVNSLTVFPTRVFQCIGDTEIKYKQRVRSRVSNLGKNVELRQQVIAGHITPTRIASMTIEVCSVLTYVRTYAVYGSCVIWWSQEMASDSMRKLRQQITEEAIRDAQVALIDGSGGSDLIRCPECSKNKCSYTQVSGDATCTYPMTHVLCCCCCC